MPFQIYEPHPSTPQNTYTHSGRGGAGNYFKAPLTTPPTQAHGPASSAPLPAHGPPFSSSSSTRTSSPNPSTRSSSIRSSPPRATERFSSGRGGAGNMHSVKEKSVFDFEDEIRRDVARTEGRKEVWWAGRGGAGNWEGREGEKKEGGMEAEAKTRAGKGRLLGLFSF